MNIIASACDLRVALLQAPAVHFIWDACLPNIQHLLHGKCEDILCKHINLRVILHNLLLYAQGKWLSDHSPDPTPN